MGHSLLTSNSKVTGWSAAIAAPQSSASAEIEKVLDRVIQGSATLIDSSYFKGQRYGHFTNLAFAMVFTN